MTERFVVYSYRHETGRYETVMEAARAMDKLERAGSDDVLLVDIIPFENDEDDDWIITDEEDLQVQREAHRAWRGY